MVDDSESVRETLQALYLHARTDKGNVNAKAALGAELDRLLYKAEDPNEGARAWLVDVLSEAPIGRVNDMAYADPHPENRRAAGIVHVTRNSQIGDRMIMKNMLKADAKDKRLDPFARNLAGLLLVKQWRAELKQNSDMAFYSEAKEFMDNKTEYLRGTRVEVAKFLLDFCVSAGKAFPVVAEIATSGEWPELAEGAGKWLIDHYIETRDVGMAKRVADASFTLASVKEYATKRFEEIKFRPIDQRVEKKTMTGMPAFRPEGMKVKIAEARGVPPSPQGMGRKITLTGPVK
jgi:hypothetical protein